MGLGHGPTHGLRRPGHLGNPLELDLLSFAADPADLDYLIAAAPAELIASTDGGRSWDLRYRDPEQER